MLEVRKLRFDYAAMPMQFDLEVIRGECLALIGPSGAGKTTLLNLIAGFEPPVSGKVLIDGRDVTRQPPAQRPLTLVFQEHNLFPHLDVLANVGLGIDPGLKLQASQRKRIQHALEQVGLAGLARRKPAELSGGQRQRVALARAVVRERPLLLLDEPFAALGPALRADMLTLVERLRHEQGLTVVLVSHHPDDARRIAERSAFLHDGRILTVDRTAYLLDTPGLPELRAYLGTLSAPHA